jgi:hypothetical protein
MRMFASALLVAAIAAHAADPAKPAPGCPAGGPHHQFDFWIGEWEVRDPAGHLQGHSRIESVVDGCGISEHWDGVSGDRGVSYNAFDAGAGKWHQFWIGNSGNGVLMLEGGLVDRSMVLLGTKVMSRTGKSQIQRIAWTPGADGSVRQVWDTSDDGNTWTNAFDGIYRKVPRAKEPAGAAQ